MNQYPVYSPVKDELKLPRPALTRFSAALLFFDELMESIQNTYCTVQRSYDSDTKCWAEIDHHKCDIHNVIVMWPNLKPEEAKAMAAGRVIERHVIALVEKGVDINMIFTATLETWEREMG